MPGETAGRRLCRARTMNENRAGGEETGGLSLVHVLAAKELGQATRRCSLTKKKDDVKANKKRCR